MQNRIMLNQANFLKAADIVRGLKADIEAGKHTRPTLAKYLSERMGMEVTAANVKGLIKACEIDEPRRASPGAKNAAHEQLMELYVELERRVVRLEHLANKALTNHQ